MDLAAERLFVQLPVGLPSPGAPGAAMLRGHLRTYSLALVGSPHTRSSGGSQCAAQTGEIRAGIG